MYSSFIKKCLLDHTVHTDDSSSTSIQYKNDSRIMGRMDVMSNDAQETGSYKKYGPVCKMV